MAIQKRTTSKGEVKFRVLVRDPRNRWYPTKSFTNRKDAERYERTLLIKKDSGVINSTLALRKMKVDQYFMLWRKKCRRCSEGWAKSQDQMYRSYIHPVIGHKSLCDLRPTDVGSVISEMTDRGEQTKRHVYNFMNLIFEDVNSYFKIPVDNPCSKKDRPIVNDTKERTVLTPEQSFKLLEVAKDEYIGAAIWISVLAGPRPSEIQALRWESVDFSMNMIRIKESFRRKEGRITAPKNRRRDAVKPLIKPLRDYLYPLSLNRSGAEFVVSGISGEMLTYNTFYRHTQVLCQRANIPIVTPHELRHSCTEIWMSAGAIEEDIIRLLSHSGSGSVRRYIHPTSGRLDEIGKRINLSVVNS